MISLELPVPGNGRAGCRVTVGRVVAEPVVAPPKMLHAIRSEDVDQPGCGEPDHRHDCEADDAPQQRSGKTHGTPTSILPVTLAPERPEV